MLYVGEKPVDTITFDLYPDLETDTWAVLSCPVLFSLFLFLFLHVLTPVSNFRTTTFDLYEGNRTVHYNACPLTIRVLDDGVSRNFERGEFTLTRLELVTSKGESSFVLHPAQGFYDGMMLQV